MATRILSPPLGQTTDGPVLCRRQILRRVIVMIRPTETSEIDANGQVLHCLWKWAGVREVEEDGIVRVPQFSDGFNEPAPIEVESNAGSYRIPLGVTLFFKGGEEGTPWDVQVLEQADFGDGRPDHFRLDTFSAGAGAIVRPEWHAYVRPLSGTLTIDGGAVVAPGAAPASLSAVSIVAAANTLYQTSIAP